MNSWIHSVCLGAILQAADNYMDTCTGEDDTRVSLMRMCWTCRWTIILEVNSIVNFSIVKSTIE